MLGFEAPDTGEIDIEEDFKKVEFFLAREKHPVLEALLNRFPNHS